MKTLYAMIACCLLISYTTFSQTISSNAPLCGNANLTLELTATGGTTYVWKGPNSFTSTQQKPSIKNVNYRNRGVYTVTIDNKTTLTTDVNIKDPVAFTVPKEISVYRQSSLLIEPKIDRLTDSTEKADSFSFIDPSGVVMENNIIKFFLDSDAGNYKVIGNSNSSGCPTTKTVKLSVKNSSDNIRWIELNNPKGVKICYGQDFSIYFGAYPTSYFKEGTKYKVYLVKRGELSPTSREPDAIVDKSPAVLKGITDNAINYYERFLIVADDAEQTKGISNYGQFPDPRYNGIYYQNRITSTTSCDTAKLNINNSNFINSFQWFQDGKAITGANSPNFITKSSGTYTVKFKGNNETSEINKTCLYESQPVKIELGKIEKPYVSVNNDIELCVGKPATLGVSSKANTNYRWKKDGNYIANATNTSYQTSQEGKYQIEAKEGTCTAVSDTVVLKKPERLDNFINVYSNSSPVEYDFKNGDVYKFCNNQTYYLLTGLGGFNIPMGTRLQYFKNKNLLKDTTETTLNNLSGEGSYFVKTVYGQCEAVSNTITVKYSNTLRGETYLRNNNLDLCEGSSAYFKLAFNGSNNYKLGDGLVYKDGKVIRNWFKYQDNNVNYYSDAEPNSESGSYYAIGKAILSDKSECLIKTDTVKVKFSKRVFQDVSDIDYPSQINLITIGTCKDTTELRSYNNIGSYSRQISYKWLKDGIVLKQDSSNILQATQSGTYQMETNYKGGCAVVSIPYKVEFGKINVNFYNPSSASICDGEKYPLYQNLSYYSNKNIYSLLKDGQFFKDEKALLQNGAYYGYFDLTQPGTYKLKVTNGKCEGTSQDFTLKVDKIPTNITPSDSVTFCTGKTVELKTSTEAGLSYIWERNGSVISQANQANYTANADGLYKATLLRGACWGITPSVKLKTLANIIPTATLTGDKKIDYDTETKLSINLTSHAPWTFKLSDGKEYTATKSPFEVSVKPLSTTTYSVSEVKNICGTGTVSGAAKIEIIILSAEEEKELNVEVFPVPSSEICHWKIETPQATNASVALYDASGITQYTHSSATRTSSHEGTINLSTLKAGTYFLKLQAGEKSVTRKVVKF